MEYSDNFKGILDDMLQLYLKKNKDYGNSFDETLDKFGLIAGIIRMNDKFNRICTLSKENALVGDEKIEDTLIDLANYTVMTLAWNNKNKKNICLE